MKKEKIANYKHIGIVSYRKNSRARNISIRINSKGDIRITVPAWCTYQRAEQFVLEKETWIRKKVLSIRQNTEHNLVWKEGDTIPVVNGSIQLFRGEQADFGYMQADKNYILELPKSYDPGNDEYQLRLRNFIAQIGLYEAKSCLPGILERIAGEHGLSYKRLTVRKMKTRWGSCSSTDNISLNSALVFLPLELIEYVCLHELVHTIHKNHSREFWNTLETILPGALTYRKQLRSYTIII